MPRYLFHEQLENVKRDASYILPNDINEPVILFLKKIGCDPGIKWLEDMQKRIRYGQCQLVNVLGQNKTLEIQVDCGMASGYKVIEKIEKDGWFMTTDYTIRNSNLDKRKSNERAINGSTRQNADGTGRNETGSDGSEPRSRTGDAGNATNGTGSEFKRNGRVNGLKVAVCATMLIAMALTCSRKASVVTSSPVVAFDMASVAEASKKAVPVSVPVYYEPVFFDFDSYLVRMDQRGKIPVGANGFIIIGYCDERGTDEYNRTLGLQRAIAVREIIGDNTIKVESAGELPGTNYDENRKVIFKPLNEEK
jgi:outer membrane protein OmpA-like peptidoglycan-associated protein